MFCIWRWETWDETNVKPSSLCNIFILQTFPTHTHTVLAQQRLCARRLVPTQTRLSALSSGPVAYYKKLNTRSQKSSVAACCRRTIQSRLLLWRWVGLCVDGGSCWGWGWGWGVGGYGEVMWWDFKASCLSRGRVISGERGEAWRSRPWILVTGCWWSPPTFPGTPRTGIYSRRCRSKSWAARRPSADTHRANEDEGWAHIHLEIGDDSTVYQRDQAAA